MNIRATDTARVNGNVNVALTKLLQLELEGLSAVYEVSARHRTTNLLLLKLGPFLLVVDQEASSSLRVTHLECMILFVEGYKVVSKWKGWKGDQDQTSRSAK